MKLICYVLFNVFLIATLVMLYYFIVPDIMEARTFELEERQREYDAKLEAASTVEKNFGEAAEVRRQFVLISQIFPSFSENFAKYLRRQGEISGTVLDEIAPISPDSLEIPGSVSFRLSLRSGYHDFAVFATNLANGEIPFRLSDLSITRLDGASDETVICKMKITSFLAERP